MIQAVADDEERGALGMHYTSVPNILKVLNPLFLDELQEKLRSRPATIRANSSISASASPASGSSTPLAAQATFFVIAYQGAACHRGRGSTVAAASPTRHTEYSQLTAFTPDIELRHFSCEIARLALIIAEYQCDVLYRGQRLALAEFLPLQKANWITCGNALQVDWLSVCPPTGKAVKLRADDLFRNPARPSRDPFQKLKAVRRISAGIRHISEASGNPSRPRFRRRS